MVENVFFLAGLKSAKNMQKISVKTYYSCFIQKATRKNASSSRNERFLKSGKNGHFAKTIARQNGRKWPILSWT